jgi:hypothetical protein
MGPGGFPIKKKLGKHQKAVVKFTLLDVEVDAMKAVKYDPDPSGVAQVQKTWVLPPGSDLTAFLFLNPSSPTG